MSRVSHTGRPIGRMDAAADRSSSVPQTRAGFRRESNPAELDWRKRAACLPWRLKARGIAPKIFFPASKDDAADAEVAKAICVADCPVREQCLRFAFDSSCGDGIFGGLDPEERRAVKRKATRGATSLNRKYSDEMRAEVLAALEAALPKHGDSLERAAVAVGKAFGVDKKTVIRWLEAETAPEGARGADAAPDGPDGRESAESPREGALGAVVTA